MYVRIYLPLAVVLWLYASVVQFIHVPFLPRDAIFPMDDIVGVFYVIFVVHTMLPISRKMSLAFGVVTALADLLVIGIMSGLDTSVKVNQVMRSNPDC